MPSRESYAYRRSARLRATRASDLSTGSSQLDNIYAKAANDFQIFCTLLDKPPAPHMLEWHRELITGQSNEYLLDIAGPNLDILSPRGSAKSSVLNMFTAWCIGRHTAAKRSLQIIYVSYNIQTAIPKSRIIKQIVDSSVFSKIFPSCKLKQGMQSDIGWSIDYEFAGIPKLGEEEFTLRAAGLRGSITSKRAHLCLVGDTLVLTDKGQVPIEALYEYPDRYRVAVRNERTGDVDWSRVGAVTKRRARGLVEITTADNRKILSTPEHPFFTAEGRYKRAGDISQQDSLIGLPSISPDKVLSGLRWGENPHTEDLPEVPFQHRAVSCGSSLSCLSENLYSSVSAASTEALQEPRVYNVFSEVCRSATETRQKDMLRVRSRVRSDKSHDKVLFEGVLNKESLQGHVRRGKCELQTRELYRELERVSKVDSSSGQFHLCRMQYEGEEVSVKKRIRKNELVCSSHRPQSRSQLCVKSDYPLSSVPHSTPSDSRQGWETISVSRVERFSTREEFVYDLEVEHTSHNFFANGVNVANCLVDDPIKSAQDIKNPTIRSEMNDNWTSVIEPIIFEGGRSICLGTRFHPLDIHKTLFCPAKKWKQVTQEALTWDDHGNPVSYWPNQWSVQFLLDKKELDPVAFAFQYQQQPVLTTDLIVSPDLLKKGEVVTEFDSLAIGIDLSASGKETSDYTAFVLGGRLGDKYYIIDAHQMRTIGNLEKIDALCDMLLEWGILTKQDGNYFPTYSTVTLVVESVAYQASLAADIKRVLLNERNLGNLNVHEVKGFRGDKIARFRGTLSLLESGKVTFNKYRKFDALFDQLVNIGATSHDDLLDAYTWLITFLQRRGQFDVQY